jgi:hypothetical protein
VSEFDDDDDDSDVCNAKKMDRFHLDQLLSRGEKNVTKNLSDF